MVEEEKLGGNKMLFSFSSFSSTIFALHDFLICMKCGKKRQRHSITLILYLTHASQ